MENDIAIYAAGYVGIRLTVLAGFVYLLYRVSAPARAPVRVEERPRGARRVAQPAGPPRTRQVPSLTTATPG